MAIQLNERDYQIFKLLDEHQALLEKHIAWFVASEGKPVLIRDRLRKLFYLDYLLCQRHDSRLPWWTTPTKPLVYMLAPLARTVSGAINIDLKMQNPDIYSNEWQRNHLEIANIKMIFVIAQKEGLLQSFEWQTCSQGQDKKPLYDAVISCTQKSSKYKIGLISHPELGRFSEELNQQDITHTMIISREQSHQESLQKSLAPLSSQINVNRVLLATHQDLYKSGLEKVTWHNLLGQGASFPANDSQSKWSSGFGTMSAA